MTGVDGDPGPDCSALGCRYRANRMGRLTIRPHAPSTSRRDQGVSTFALPICDDHADELRDGVTVVEFSTGR